MTTRERIKLVSNAALGLAVYFALVALPVVL
jgi:hypothetical protein